MKMGHQPINDTMPECAEHWRCAELLLRDGTRLHRPLSDTGASPLFIGDSVVTWFISGYPQEATWYTVTFPLSQVDQIAEHRGPRP